MFGLNLGTKADIVVGKELKLKDLFTTSSNVILEMARYAEYRHYMSTFKMK